MKLQAWKYAGIRWNRFHTFAISFQSRKYFRFVLQVLSHWVERTFPSGGSGQVSCPCASTLPECAEASVCVLGMLCTSASSFCFHRRSPGMMPLLDGVVSRITLINTQIVAWIVVIILSTSFKLKFPACNGHIDLNFSIFAVGTRLREFLQVVPRVQRTVVGVDSFEHVTVLWNQKTSSDGTLQEALVLVRFWRRPYSYIFFIYS